MPTKKDDLRLPTQHAGRVWHYTPVGQMHAPHHHEELEINLVTQGTATYLLGDRRYELRRHTLVWLFPDQEHVLLDQSPDHAMWIGVFKPDLLRHLCTTPPTQTLCAADPDGWYCRTLAEDDARRLDTLLDVHPAVERAVRLLRGPDAPETLGALAAHVGLSASRLSRLFRRQTGVSLADFRNAQRLERFLRLYGRGRRLSVSQAALEAGFGSYPQFHRVFTRRMGCSPAAYRRRQAG